MQPSHVQSSVNRLYHLFSAHPETMGYLEGGKKNERKKKQPTQDALFMTRWGARVTAVRVVATQLLSIPA